LAAEHRVDPVDLIIDMALERELRLFFVQPMGRFDPADLERVMKHPRTVMTFSDSGAHVSQMADASIQTHLLSHWVRDRQAFTFEEAIRMVSFVPATVWGFSDRGLVREGFVADLNVINPQTVAPEMPILVDDLPGKARRLIQHATGYRATIVGGEVVHLDGEHTGALPGRLLRGPLASA
jgi:N-acyl-D-aspartate/D-glutamate deacylase